MHTHTQWQLTHTPRCTCTLIQPHARKLSQWNCLKIQRFLICTEAKSKCQRRAKCLLLLRGLSNDFNCENGKCENGKWKRRRNDNDNGNENATLNGKTCWICSDRANAIFGFCDLWVRAAQLSDSWPNGISCLPPPTTLRALPAHLLWLTLSLTGIAAGFLFLISFPFFGFFVASLPH